MSYRFYFCDPVASFGAESPGRRAKRILDKHGRQHLGVDAWELGSKAYDPLRNIEGQPPSIADLEAFISQSKSTLKEFFEKLGAEAASGRITLVGRESGEPISPYSDWSEGEWPVQILNLVKIVQQVMAERSFAGDDTADYYPLEGFESDMLVAVLCLLDSAVLWSLDHASTEVAEDLLNAAWLFEQVEARERLEEAGQRIATGIVRKRASERARVRHAKDPKRQARDFVKECWQTWRNSPGQYPSAAAFARAMLDKQPDLLKSEVVIARWVRAWDQEAERSTASDDD